MIRLAAVAIVVGLAQGHASADQVVFRAETSMVFVDVSVKKGNNPVLGLQAFDFVLLDNGVPQKISAVAMEAVPIDVSLFIDTSGSTAAVLEEMKSSVGEIMAMLRPTDRFRLLTIGHSVYQAVPWTVAGAPIDLAGIYPVSGISLVYDGFYAASVHAVEPGRRHLVVGLTDGADECSVVSPQQLRELVGRTEAVVHWVPMKGTGRGVGGRADCDRAAPNKDVAAVGDLVDGTGGDRHTGVLGIVGMSPVKAFRRVLDEYRQSYVLSYTPEGVPRYGWHQLTVRVPSGKYSIRARAGYFGG
jgi:hypothetical protein